MKCVLFYQSSFFEDNFIGIEVAWKTSLSVKENSAEAIDIEADSFF